MADVEGALPPLDDGTPYYASRTKSNAANGGAAYDASGVHYAAYQEAAAINRQFKRRTGQMWVSYGPGDDKTYSPEGCYDFTKDDCALGRSCKYRHDIPGQCKSVKEGKQCHRPNCLYNHTVVDPLKIPGFFEHRDAQVRALQKSN
jgi:hypothetical protein